MTEAIYDIPYATQSPDQKLDIYLPQGAKEPYPVIIFLHPGGFSQGDKDMIKSMVRSMLARGYAAVSVNYRLAGSARFPAQIQDAKTAVRWTRANAARYNFNADKIIAWGISAGSMLAALLGTAGSVKEMEDLSAGNAAESSRVNAVVSLYGPMDFINLESQQKQLGQKPLHDSEESGEAQMMGGGISRVPEKYKAASPMTYVNDQCPPFYIQHGTADEVIPYLQSVQFAGALEAAMGKSKVKLKLIEKAGHFDRIQTSPENINAAIDFLDEQLK